MNRPFAGSGNPRRPRIGCLGVGWIGRHRMEAIVHSGAAELVAVADPSSQALAPVRETFPAVAVLPSADALLDLPLDGVVIATPNALHAAQTIAALERGISVFCQKPLGRNAGETGAMVEAARRRDRLLGVDLSYRQVRGVADIREMVLGGELGYVFAIDLAFHNAYGPDKAWFYDPALSGGGCVIDLGTHLIDLGLWTLDFPAVAAVSSRLYAQGQPWSFASPGAEDYATVRFDLDGGTTMTLACSWHLHAGRDAVIEASFFGTLGGASLRNVGGSFYDFTVERFQRTSSATLSAPPDAWSGRAVVGWARRLAADPGFDPGVEQAVAVAAAVDAIYGRPAPGIAPEASGVPQLSRAP